MNGDQYEELMRLQTKVVLAEQSGFPLEPGERERFQAITMRLASENPGVALRLMMDDREKPPEKGSGTHEK